MQGPQGPWFLTRERKEWVRGAGVTADNRVSSVHPLKGPEEAGFVVAALLSGEAENHRKGVSK